MTQTVEVPWATCPGCEERGLVRRGPIAWRGMEIIWLACTNCNLVAWPRWQQC